MIFFEIRVFEVFEELFVEVGEFGYVDISLFCCICVRRLFVGYVKGVECIGRGNLVLVGDIGDGVVVVDKVV